MSRKKAIWMVCVAASVAVLAGVFAFPSGPAVTLQVVRYETNFISELPKRPIHSVVLRMTNSGSATVSYHGTPHEEPFYRSEVLKEGMWTDDIFVACGFGLQELTLPASGSTEFKALVIGPSFPIGSQ